MDKRELLEYLKDYEERIKSLEKWLNNLLDWDMDLKRRELSDLWDDFNRFLCKVEKDAEDE